MNRGPTPCVVSLVGAQFITPAAPTGLHQVHAGSAVPVSRTWHRAADVLPAQPAGVINRAPTWGCGVSHPGGRGELPGQHDQRHDWCIGAINRGPDTRGAALRGDVPLLAPASFVGAQFIAPAAPTGLDHGRGGCSPPEQHLVSRRRFSARWARGGNVSWGEPARSIARAGAMNRAPTQRVASHTRAGVMNYWGIVMNATTGALA